MKILAIVLVAIAVGVVGGMYIPTKTVEPTALATPQPTPTSVIKSGPPVLQAIQAQAKLQSVKMIIAQDTNIARAHGVLGACSEEITYLGYFNITAGVDLAKITDDNLQVEHDGQPELAKVTITLPQSELMSNELDMTHSHIVAMQTPKWVPGCTHEIADMTIEAQQKLQQTAEVAAKEQGIMQMASDKAGVALQRLLYSVGYRDVVIRSATS